MTDDQEVLFDDAPLRPESGPGAVTPPKKRAQPKSWTPDTKERAHKLLKPWWVMYGTGWGQSYAVVFRVVMALFKNSMSEADIKRAMIVLGQERTPISGGSVTFALKRLDREAAGRKQADAAKAATSMDKFHQRTM